MPTQANDSQEKVRRLQRMLYQAAKTCPRRRFHALYDKVYRWDILQRAWHEVRLNHGKEGIDGQTLEQIEQELGVESFLRGLQKELEEGMYRPLPVRRVEIPRRNSATRNSYRSRSCGADRVSNGD